MRITDGMMVGNMLKNLQNNRSELDKLNQQLSSGKQFSKPSDDPIGVTTSMGFHTKMNNYEQYQKDVNNAKSWLESTENSLSDAGKILQRSSELAIYGANDTLNPDDRKNMSEEVKELRNELISIANSKLGQDYLFAGQASGTKPIEVNNEYHTNNDLTLNNQNNISSVKRSSSTALTPGNYTVSLEENGGTVDTINISNEEGEIVASKTNDTALTQDTEYEVETDNGEKLTIKTGNNNPTVTDQAEFEIHSYVKYKGDHNKILRKISDDNNMKVNANADKVFKQNIEIVNNLYEDLKAGKGGEKISAYATKLQNGMTNNTGARAEVGAKINRLDLITNRIDDELLNTEKLNSKNEDIDLAKLVTDLKMSENVYRASLSSAARVIQPSLVDFLK
ncbi:MAG TPA: flagellar hook-associated protein FlgL [Halanaerobiales bacterium]|nr:flagellar hook-associated protein FlgL [Halanaerobiales bacterium]